MAAALRAGSVYFAVMFALGFVLGTIRVVLLAPGLGAMTATLIELPVMLAASWFVCRWAVARWRVPWRPGARLAMGALAFALLIAAEVVLGTLGFGRSVGEQIAAMLSPEGLAGLAGQLLFALFPLARR